MNIYFSDFFNINPAVLEENGTFNISLINDLPLFIDPFLLFNSKNENFKKLHDEIIEYVRFLREMAFAGEIKKGLLINWFFFPEVKQNWLGYSKTGNRGSGLGQIFADALHGNLSSIFRNFGNEEITQSSHLEKLCLIKDGVGRDNISDFTTNLIKGFLCNYTEIFSEKYLSESQVEKVMVRHVKFNYRTRSWENKEFSLPTIDGDFILLTPKEILTKDDTWINRNDLVGDFKNVADSIKNVELRGLINDYFLRMLPLSPKKKEINHAVTYTIHKFPELIDHYIKYKEDHGDEAEKLSSLKVLETENIFIHRIKELVQSLSINTNYHHTNSNTLEEAYQRVLYLKQVIENNDGYKIFYIDGQPIKREADLQLMFRLTWYGTKSDVNSEVNNGRGPVDYKISRGNSDSTLVEFKLASNSKLKQNLANQVQVYQKANNTKKSIKVILCFNVNEFDKVFRIMKELGLKEGNELVLIDADSTSKTSASNVRS
ncbi:MAG: hypothetical protein KJ630_13060 [Proteobacteria bacterium]|nr:hypothetical protein [Pseudomonadota bacterium]